MKKSMIAWVLSLTTHFSFAFNDNPKSWNQGVLYEKVSSSSSFYLFIHPSGKFFWFDDDGVNIDYAEGNWKRNPVTATIRFFSDHLWITSYIKKPLQVKEQGLFNGTMDKPLFILADEHTQQLLLPQIEHAMSEKRTDHFFFSVLEVGKRKTTHHWNQEEGLQKDAFEVVKKLGQMDYKAQKWADQSYTWQRGTRLNWGKQYPTAFETGRKLFGGIPTDSGKIRAMCNWMETNVKYNLVGARRDNPDHSPEVFFTLKYGLCLDYARLLNVFCESVGIPCIDIAGYPVGTQDGKVNPGRDSYHAWNYVKVNGEWLAVDPTWYDKDSPRDHFLIPLAAYQYEHVPDNDVEKANPFAPLFKSDLMRCPVVKQYNMDLMYLGNYETMVEVKNDTLRVCFYAKKPMELNLHIDSIQSPHHMHSFSICIGCEENNLERDKGKRHQTYSLKRGVNWISIPLTATIAEYTLINDDFEWMVKAYREQDKNIAFKRVTHFTDSTWCVTKAYQLLGDWMQGKEVLTKNISSYQAQHPNWQYIREDYHNQEMTYTVQKEEGKTIAYFRFTDYTIAGKEPAIRMEVDADYNALSEPRLYLSED